MQLDHFKGQVELRPARKKRFYYVRTDAKCVDDKAGKRLKMYLSGSLAAAELESFQRHLEQCLLCSAKVDNRQTLQAAMDYYRITPEEAVANPGEVTRRMNLTVVDLTGRKMPHS